MTNDVEKRCHDPRALRTAVIYAVVVLLLAVVAFVVYALGDQSDIGRAMATPGVLFVGALGAFVKTYRDWRVGRTWPIWQGAGWFLLTMTLVAFGIPAMGIPGAQ
jgi:membrane protease YdiL (CAAX protease family)